MTARRHVVVVGGGAAGCVVAAACSADPSTGVTLLEAGPGGLGLSAPAGIGAPSFFTALATPGRTWEHLMARRTARQAPAWYPRGRGLGGSSSVFGMMAMRGEPDDYDRWVAEGATGWSASEVWDTFDGLPVPLIPATDEEHGPLARAVLAALPGHAHAVALARTASGRRASSAEVFLAPVVGRANLAIRTETLVDRILLDGRRAAGVRLANGEELTADEVVVCAGAIHTPAILLRSGIDRPGIGAGLQDHPAFPIPLRLRVPPPSEDSLPATVIASFSSGRSPADLQLLVLDHLGPDRLGAAKVDVALMDVRSRGRVRLASDDPEADPVVEFDLLSDPEDLARLRSGIEMVRDALTRDPIRAVAEWDEPDVSDDAIRASIGDYVHACGTCRMGSPDDPRAVTDPLGRVLGVDGLRVADASLFPTIPRANTFLPTVMAAQHLCDRWELLRTGP
ncbi:MAG: GMC family oxidoreductase N-terminal domain-containing protein [Ilumatobacteraceae bacterium]